MTVERTLARVEDDLRTGEVAMARTRLRSLVAAFPQRLDLRERLAHAYRLEGDKAQAGRWSFLAEDRDPAELAAFGKAYRRDAVRVMGALGWRGDEDDAATPTARDRLREIRARAEEQAQRPLEWAEVPSGVATDESPLAVVGCALVALALLVVFVVGAVSVVGWVVRAIAS